MGARVGLSKQLSTLLRDQFPEGLPRELRVTVGERWFIIRSAAGMYPRLAACLCGTTTPLTLKTGPIARHSPELKDRYADFVAPLRQACYQAAENPVYHADRRMRSRYPPPETYILTDATLWADKQAVLASRLDADVLWDLGPVLGRFWRHSMAATVAWRKYWGGQIFGSKAAPERKDSPSDDEFAKKVLWWTRVMKYERQLEASKTAYTQAYESVTRALKENPDITIAEYRARYGAASGAGTEPDTEPARTEDDGA